MNKDGYVKIGAVVFAFLLFSRTSSAASNSKLASADAKAANEKVTALQQQLGLPEDGASDSTGTTTVDAHGVSASAKKSPTTTVKKAVATGATGTAKTHASATGASGTSALHWTYEGDTGPAQWGSLDTSYATCLEGSKQSPIDLTGAKSADLPDLVFHYEPASGSIIDNGHTIQVDVKAGDTVTIDEGTFTLVQFHFHGPSEHKVAGKPYPLEVHFVHKDAAGKLAVVGVLVAEGEPNAAFDALIANLPTEANKAKALASPVDVAAMLPAIQATYRYAGSLTTPPCTEGVTWNVMAQPITMSKAQIASFTAAFAEPNNRPTQKLGARPLAVDSTVDLGH
jgi:carbonic anhydrase